jgi:hypothetical protein
LGDAPAPQNYDCSEPSSAVVGRGPGIIAVLSPGLFRGVFVCLVMADDASGASTEHPMVHHVSRDAADCRPFQTPLCLCGSCKAPRGDQAQNSCGRNDFHLPSFHAMLLYQSNNAERR